MTELLSEECKPNGHYSKSRAASFLGINRSQLNDFIGRGYIKVSLHKYTQEVFIKGSEIIRFFNAVS